jgi:hypothetical protein
MLPFATLAARIVTMESNRTARPVSSHLKVGVAAVGVAGGYVVAVLFFGRGALAVFLVLPVLLTLLCGAVLVLVGLAQKANRQRPRLWKHIGTLLSILALLYLLSIGPCNASDLFNQHVRLTVLLTGGQDELQSWAVDLLGKPRDGMDHDGGTRWTIPQEYWSPQVRRLGPAKVFVDSIFENEGEGVCLFYGGGFLHWSIVAGPPGSRPNPEFDYPARDSIWFRWADGLYNWLQY